AMGSAQSRQYTAGCESDAKQPQDPPASHHVRGAKKRPISDPCTGVIPPQRAHGEREANQGQRVPPAPAEHQARGCEEEHDWSDVAGQFAKRRAERRVEVLIPAWSRAEKQIVKHRERRLIPECDNFTLVV